MDYAHHSSTGAAAESPSIPTRTRYNSTTSTQPRRWPSKQGPSGVGSKRQSVPPAASPEVISNLISSLSGISKPADDYFEGKHATSATSPATSPGADLLPPRSLSSSRAASNGSFGVDYGAYGKTSSGYGSTNDPVSLDEIAASPPVVRTSKPTSGYSPLVPPKSPKRVSSRDNSTGGLRSFIRSSSNHSRPSTNGSGKNDDTSSIGNLSVERGSSLPDQELTHRRSTDSWSKKSGRNYKGLMYMSSRERLRDKEERKRSAEVVAGGSLRSRSYGNLNGASGPVAAGATGGNSSHSANKPDPFLAETAISEEPATSEGPFASSRTAPGAKPAVSRAMESLQSIPARDSSLRKANPPRTSSRRPVRDSSLGRSGQSTADTGTKARESSQTRGSGKKVPARLDLNSNAASKSFYLGPDETAPAPAETPTTQRFLETIRDDYLAFDNHTPGREEPAADEEGAPFPSVSQNRRRSTQSIDKGSRRRSGASPAPGADGKPKRSSSRLKRLSRPSSPTADSKKSNDLYRDNDVGVPLERLDSVDSIDDAVESYLCSPRLTQKIKHPQTGRTICFSEVGDSEGSAVFCCVGMGLTRYITAFYDELALTLKLRLITPDRPGVGESDPYPDGSTTPLSWPGTFLLLTRLKHELTMVQTMCMPSVKR